MTALRIFATAVSGRRSGPLGNMARHDALSWKLTRERHPQYYKGEAK